MLTPIDLLATEPTMPTLDPTTPTPTTDTTLDTDTTDLYAYDPTLPPVPPNPTAEPFIPASSPSITTPTTPRDRAYALYLQGYRSPAIAAHLHVPQRTIRHWIQTANQQINDLPALANLDDLDDLTGPSDPTAREQQATHAIAAADHAAFPLLAAGRGQGERSLTMLQHQRTLAVERHRARSAAAWALHEQLRATLDPFLARLSERLLLHTQYPDDTDHVSMSTLELAGGPLSPAFRAMYHMLPGLIGGLTRSLALAERADLQIDRLLGLPLAPSSASSPSSPSAASSAPATATATTAPKSTPKQPAKEEPATPWPTREEINRAVEAERIAEEDAYVIPRLTARQRHLIRLYASLPAVLPDGPIETWDITIDPNAPLTGWRDVLLPRRAAFLDDPDHDDDPDDPDDGNPDGSDDLDDDDRDPTPPSGQRGTPSGKEFGTGETGGTSSGKRSTPSRPPHHARNGVGKDARTDAPKIGKHSGNESGNESGNKIGNCSGNTGKKIGNDSGNPTASPHGPFPPSEGVGG